MFVLLGSLPSQARTVRAGLFIGANHGSFGEDVLFFAKEDALKMYLAFLEYGQLNKNLALVVSDSKLKSVQSKIGELAARTQLLKDFDDTRLECIFYYSGHGGLDGLHLDGKTYTYQEFYQDIHSLACDLSIIILDACNSGSLLKVKGITFVEDEYRVKIYDNKTGEIFITSSADSEYAQEKEEFKGSIFTFYLVNGLIGAADINQDGRITLSEAYNFASRRTIQETFGSAKGFQVPSYKYQVQGSQDTVLTELSAEKESIMAPQNREGIMTFMDSQKGIIWGDFKVDRHRRQIFVPTGRYLVRLRTESGDLYLAECHVMSDQKTHWQKFKKISSSQDPIKGQRILNHVDVRFSGGAMVSSDSSIIRNVNFGGNLSLLMDNIVLPPLYAGLRLGLFFGQRSETVFDTNIDYSSRLIELAIIGGIKTRIFGFIELAAELQIGGGQARLKQSTAFSKNINDGYYLIAGLAGQAVWWLSPDIGLVLPHLQLSLMSYQKENQTQNPLGLAINAGMQFKF
jgi:hypothetical protein